jgi:regulatory protein
MRLNKIASKPDGVGRYRVEFEDGSVMRLYRQTLEDHCLYAGQDLTEQEMDALRSDAGRTSAKMRAVRILTASDVSRDDLRQRLVQKGESKEDAANAVAWMEELQLVDDRRTAAMIVSRCAAKGYGLARAKQALYEKRIPKQYWDEALEDYPDQTDTIVAYLRSHIKGNADEREKKRAVDALLRRGHSYGQIRAAMRQLDFDEFQEDWNG